MIALRKRISVRITLLLVVISAVGVVNSAPAHAASCTVPGTHASLNAAATDVNCTEIKIGAGVFYENVFVNHPTTITGSGGKCGKSKTIVDASPGGVNGKGFDVVAINVTIQNLAIRHGTHGIKVFGDDFTASKLCVFGQRESDADGIHVEAGENATVLGSSFHSSDGEGVHLEGGTGGALIQKNISRNQGSDCIKSEVPDARILDNTLHDCDDQGIRSFGANALIEGNKISSVNHGIEHTDGANAVIRDNKITGANDNGIRANSADGHIVEDNTIVGSRSRCINMEDDVDNGQMLGNTGSFCGGTRIEGDNPVVRDNVLKNIWDSHGYRIECGSTCTGAHIAGNSVDHVNTDKNGFEVSSDGPGGLVEGNISRYSGNHGFLIQSVDGWTFRDNTALFSGKREDSNFRNGFQLDDSDGNTLEFNLAKNGRDDGFHITGNSDGNTLTGNASLFNTKDGFHVAGTTGTPNSLAENDAEGNHAEGFENDGLLTTFNNNDALGNRTDCNGFDGTLDPTSSGNVCADGSVLTAAVLPVQGQVD